MVSRTDGKPFPSEAQIDPDRCIGCGVCSGSCDTQAIGVPWFDAQQVIRELELVVAAETDRGEPPALAFVCAQADGGWELFDADTWRRRLPGYTVRLVPCVGWIEPKVIERVIRKGATAVMIVGCGSSEAFCKEGNQWMSARLKGEREPEFRPNRADPRKVAHVNFDPLRPHLLSKAANSLRAQLPAPDLKPPARAATWLAGLLLAMVTLVALIWGSDTSFRNPAPLDPEFVFTFRANGDWLSGAAVALPDPAQDTRPIHMRTALPTERNRVPVTVRIEVDGQLQEHVFAPKGFKSDGSSVGDLRVRLAPGPHQIVVSVATSVDPMAKPLIWSAEVEAHPRRFAVLSYEAEHGFQFEP